MQRILIVLTLMAFVGACASSSSRATHSKVTMTGGHYQLKSWDDTLIFSRVSWYIGAIMGYDVLMAKLDKTSPFANWLGNDKEKISNECHDFYITLIYTNTNSMMLNLASPADIKKQIVDLGYEEVSILDFKTNMAAHDIYGQWHLNNHKFSGFCYKHKSNKNISVIPKQIPISLPGFKTQNIVN